MTYNPEQLRLHSSGSKQKNYKTGNRQTIREKPTPIFLESPQKDEVPSNCGILINIMKNHSEFRKYFTEVEV